MDETPNPFQSPETADGIAESRVPPYASGRLRAACAIGALVFFLSLDARYIYFHAVQLGLVFRSEHGEPLDARALAAVGRDAWALYPLWLITIGTTILTYFVWLHRAYRNLPALGNPSTSTTPTVAVGLHFIPVVNLFMPYALMAEIWRWSDPAQAAREHRSASRLVAAWWGFFLLSDFLFFAANSQLSDQANPSIDALKYVWLWKVAQDAAQIVCAILAIRLVWKINQNQEAMHLIAPVRSPGEIPDTFSSAD